MVAQWRWTVAQLRRTVVESRRTVAGCWPSVLVVASSSCSLRGPLRCFEPDPQRVAVHLRAACGRLQQRPWQDKAATPAADVQHQLLARSGELDVAARR